MLKEALFSWWNQNHYFGTLGLYRERELRVRDLQQHLRLTVTHLLKLKPESFDMNILKTHTNTERGQLQEKRTDLMIKDTKMRLKGCLKKWECEEENNRCGRMSHWVKGFLDSFQCIKPDTFSCHLCPCVIFSWPWHSHLLPPIIPTSSTMMAVIHLSPVSHVWWFDGSGPEVTQGLEAE